MMSRLRAFLAFQSGRALGEMPISRGAKAPYDKSTIKTFSMGISWDNNNALTTRRHKISGVHERVRIPPATRLEGVVITLLSSGHRVFGTAESDPNNQGMLPLSSLFLSGWPSYGGSASDCSRGSREWAAAVIGGYVGAAYGSKRFGSTTLKRLLAIVLVIAGLKMIFT